MTYYRQQAEAAISIYYRRLAEAAIMVKTVKTAADKAQSCTTQNFGKGTPMTSSVIIFIPKEKRFHEVHICF
ncbi:uncharacterized protein G2W53_025369 [Senna tora]|uniref:Uncharacterized protein n=1 Tax=Senna tora TaxID=362788 RepID=A0A834TM33_9FABA|nr:uncharacterized protein G2W53_025369 [Senna tora]